MRAIRPDRLRQSGHRRLLGLAVGHLTVRFMQGHDEDGRTVTWVSTATWDVTNDAAIFDILTIARDGLMANALGGAPDGD